jgi:predicted HTH transcriptional regulator
MEMYPNISVRKMEQETSISRRTIENNIKLLKNDGFIQRIGARKNGHWQIIKQIANCKKDDK